MDINLIAIVIFLSSLIPTLITLYLTEKVKANIKSSFDQKLEVIKKEHTLEISKFQTELNFLKTKENFKFTKLHEKRFEVLEKTYQYLNNSLNKLNSYIIPLKQVPEGITFEENEDLLLNDFRDAQNTFANYFYDNKIYFDQELEELIQTYMSETISTYNNYNENHFMQKFGAGFNSESSKKALTAYKSISEKMVPIKKEVEKKFKELLEN